MFQQQANSQATPFHKLGFSQTVWRCLARSENKPLLYAKDEQNLLFNILDEARKTVSVASNETVGRILNVNGCVVRLDETVNNGLIALLPLNMAGYEALVSGRFEGRNPNVSWICKSGEAPFAIYVWLVFMPGSFAGSLGAIAKMVDELAIEPCPLFSRATTTHSDKLHQNAGFLRAQDYFPNANADLQVVFPVGSLSISRAKSNQVEISVARTVEDIFQVFSVRSATYLAEQFCLYNEEFDGNDFCSTHFLGKVAGDAAGCVRLRFFAGFAKLERLAVRTEYRQSKLAYQLVRAALRHCQSKGYAKIIGHSRLDLVRFWRVFGFQPIKGREPFSFANVQYVELQLDQTIAIDAINIEAEPLIMIRPEGAWERPGPFDRPDRSADEARKKLLSERTRTIKNQSITA